MEKFKENFAYPCIKCGCADGLHTVLYIFSMDRLVVVCHRCGNEIDKFLPLDITD